MYIKDKNESQTKFQFLEQQKLATKIEDFYLVKNSAKLYN